MTKKPFPPNQIPKPIIEAIVTRALEEDLANGDVTSQACIAPTATCTAYSVARTPLITCGNAIAACVFEKIDPQLTFKILLPDGTPANSKQTLWQISGNTRSILLGERVALNFVQHLSGIATLTAAYVQAIPKGSSARITDTRKTTPGLRPLERYAVRIGGGFNHRDNLGSAILIKDNHIAACGSITEAIRNAKAFASHTCRIECEVENLTQLEEALDAGADIILLDNMDTSMIAKAVQITQGKAILEASGKVTLERIPEIAKTGVHFISVGAITHSAPAVDIGLDI